MVAGRTTHPVLDRDPDGGSEYVAEDFEIYVMNADGTGVVRLTDNSTYDYPVAWSPDGRRILFVSDRNGNDFEIYTMNADGSRGWSGSPTIRPTIRPAAWSPDGRRILFVSDPDGGEYWKPEIARFT